MKHVTDQRKRKRWLAPLALCLAVCLAIHPASLNAVQAGEDEVSAFWDAAEAFWGEDGKVTAFWNAHNALWGNEDEGITGAMNEYYEAGDDTEARDAARKKVQDAIAVYKAAYPEVGPAFDNVTEKYDALTEDEQTAKNEEEPEAMSIQELYGLMEKSYKGDDTGNYMAIDQMYEESCTYIEDWEILDSICEYTDSFNAYWEARNLFWESTNDFFGNEPKDIAGAYPTYMAALESGAENLDALYEEVLAARAAVEEACETLTVKYQAENAAYEALTDAQKQAPYGDDGTVVADIHNDVVDDYTVGWVPNTYKDCEEAFKNLDIREYINSNDAYWKARAVFLESTNNFLGNEQENIVGAHPTYMAALESKAENLDALYEEALAARAAVEEAYKTMTEKYQAENAEYEALTEDCQQAQYGNITVADVHASNINDYTEGWVPETYNLIHECEIPAPPQEEPVATPTPAPTTPPQEDPVATPTPAPTTPPQEDPVATPTPAPTTPPQEDPVATPTPEPTTPPQEDPVATPTPAPTTPPQDDPVATPTPAPTTPPQEDPVATPTPAPTTPSGQGAAAQSAPAQEPLADWNVVYKDVDNSVASGEAQNVYAQAGTQFQVNGNILDKLAGSKTALFLNTGTGLSFSISGVDVPQGVSSLKVAMATADGIPETAKQSVLTGAAFSRTFAMEDKSVYPVKIDVHLNVGKENAGKNAYLYYYDETTGNLKLAGAFRATEAGQVMFAINRGDEYIVVVADNAAMQLGRYTVMPGDSLSRIAAKNGISLKQLLKVNPGIKNPNRIHPGDVINLD